MATTPQMLTNTSVGAVWTTGTVVAHDLSVGQIVGIDPSYNELSIGYVSDEEPNVSKDCINYGVVDRIRALLWGNVGLLHPKLKASVNVHPLAGHCYVASEAYYHLCGKSDGFKPCRVRVGGVVHWFLRSDHQTLDITAEQFEDRGILVPYRKGQVTGFLTKEPSKRAAQVIEAIQADYDDFQFAEPQMPGVIDRTVESPTFMDITTVSATINASNINQGRYYANDPWQKKLRYDQQQYFAHQNQYRNLINASAGTRLAGIPVKTSKQVPPNTIMLASGSP